MAPPYDGPGPHGVLPPDGLGIWHRVEQPLDPRSICGMELLYGSRLGSWLDIAAMDRCRDCGQIAEDLGLG